MKADAGDLYREYHDLVRATAYKYGFRGEQLDDVVQDVFVKVMEKIETLKDPKALISWLIRMTANHCINLQKKNQRFTNLNPDLPEPADESGDHMADHFVCVTINGEVDVAWEHLSGLLKECINRVKKEPVRRVLSMRLEENMKFTEIANQVGMPENTVRGHVHRFRKSIEKSIVRLLMKNLPGQSDQLAAALR